MSKLSEWARRTVGLPPVNVAKSPLGGLVTQAITAPVARQIAAQLPTTELNTLYTAAITELLRRQRAANGVGKEDDEPNG